MIINNYIQDINDEVLIYDSINLIEDLEDIIKVSSRVNSIISKIDSSFIGCNNSNINLNNNIFRLDFTIHLRIELLNVNNKFMIENHIYNKSIYLISNKDSNTKYNPKIIYNYEKIFNKNKLYFALVIINKEG